MIYSSHEKILEGLFLNLHTDNILCRNVRLDRLDTFNPMKSNDTVGNNKESCTDKNSLRSTISK